MAPNRKRKSRYGHSAQSTPPPNAPSVERQQHDRIALAERQIFDSVGQIGAPYHVASKLDQMLNRGDITEAMHKAGEHFQDVYRIAATGGVRAIDWQRSIRGGTDSMSLAVLRAREARDGAMAVLGNNTPIGCCAWFVLGEEMSLRDWAIREGWNNRPLREETAKGLLIGALGVLATYFGFAEKSA